MRFNDEQYVRELAASMDMCAHQMRKIMLTKANDPAEREKCELLISTYARLARLLRAYADDPDEETAEQIDEAFATVCLPDG